MDFNHILFCVDFSQELVSQYTNNQVVQWSVFFAGKIKIIKYRIW